MLAKKNSMDETMHAVYLIFMKNPFKKKNKLNKKYIQNKLYIKKFDIIYGNGKNICDKRTINLF